MHLSTEWPELDLVLARCGLRVARDGISRGARGIAAMLPGTNIDEDQRQCDALEVLDLLGPADNSAVAAASTSGGGDAMPGAADGAMNDAVESGAGAGVADGMMHGNVSPAGLLQVLEALGPSAAAALSEGGANFTISPDRLSATELEAVLDLLGAPSDVEPISDQSLFQRASQRAQEEPRRTICQAVSTVKETAAAPSPLARANVAVASVTDDMDWDCPD